MARAPGHARPTRRISRSTKPARSRRRPWRRPVRRWNSGETAPGDRRTCSATVPVLGSDRRPYGCRLEQRAIQISDEEGEVAARHHLHRLAGRRALPTCTSWSSLPRMHVHVYVRPCVAFWGPFDVMACQMPSPCSTAGECMHLPRRGACWRYGQASTTSAAAIDDLRHCGGQHRLSRPHSSTVEPEGELLDDVFAIVEATMRSVLQLTGDDNLFESQEPPVGSISYMAPTCSATPRVSAMWRLIRRERVGLYWSSTRRTAWPAGEGLRRRHHRGDGLSAKEFNGWRRRAARRAGRGDGRMHFTVYDQERQCHWPLHRLFGTEADEELASVFYGLFPTAPSVPTRTRSRSSARKQSSPPGPLRLRLQEYWERSPSPTCASASARSARPISWTAPASWPATSSSSWTRSTCSTMRRRVRRSC